MKVTRVIHKEDKSLLSSPNDSNSYYAMVIFHLNGVQVTQYVLFVVCVCEIQILNSNFAQNLVKGEGTRKCTQPGPLAVDHGKRITLLSPIRLSKIIFLFHVKKIIKSYGPDPFLLLPLISMRV